MNLHHRTRGMAYRPGKSSQSPKPPAQPKVAPLPLKITLRDGDLRLEGTIFLSANDIWNWLAPMGLVPMGFDAFKQVDVRIGRPWWRPSFSWKPVVRWFHMQRLIKEEVFYKLGLKSHRPSLDEIEAAIKKKPRITIDGVNLYLMPE